MSKVRHYFFNTQFITATISTTLVLVLLGIIVLFVITAQNLSSYVKENINVSVL
ncbi:MAG: cell division protein FtsX, partial [Bacteroidales bacterium]|nr:cell division protein FtsX [Bacteroidales bacterium]